MKNEKGITLISLVITIVILIILASVTINLSIGNESLFNRAKQAKEEYLNAEVNERIAINEITEYVENYETEKQKVTNIELNKTEIKIYLGETEQLEAKILPTNAYNKNIEWISDNEEIATVSNTGLVTAKASGTTKIEAKSTDNSEVTVSCIVTVVEKIYLVKDGVEEATFEEINIKSHTQEDGYALIETETTTNRATFQLLNLIELEEYKNITVEVEVTNYIYSKENDSAFEIMISKDIKPHEGKGDKAVAIMHNSYDINYRERKIYTINLEGVIGTYGIGLRKNASLNSSVTFKLYNMWLEK